MKEIYDVAVIGAGAAGITAAITAARDKKRVLLIEKLPRIGAKLKATGGGRCNLTNTLSNEEFMTKFGKSGRFMQDALKEFDHKKLIDFFKDIGVQTHAPDGFRVFPTSHSSQTILDALLYEIKKLHVELLTSAKVENILHVEDHLFEITAKNDTFYANNVIIATGGLGYPTLGAQGDGYAMAKALGHTVTKLYPAMTPLKTKEKWVSNCRADTIPKAQIRVAVKKYAKLKACGDLIFTKEGIRGPLVLDFARDVTPLLEKYGEVPVTLNMVQGKSEDDIISHLKSLSAQNPCSDILSILSTFLPRSVSLELLVLAGIDSNETYPKIGGAKKAALVKLVASTPLTVRGHDGFDSAMITRGGVSLKEIDPKTMQSKIDKGLYFCGEVMDIDGPCGGYNLQWSFSSGYLAGKLRN